MSGDDLQEFLQETLKKTWTLDDDVVIKKLQDCKRELAKLKCPLPAEGEPRAGFRQPVLPWGCQQWEDPGPWLTAPWSPDALLFSQMAVSLSALGAVFPSLAPTQVQSLMPTAELPESS